MDNIGSKDLGSTITADINIDTAFGLDISYPPVITMEKANTMKNNNFFKNVKGGIMALLEYRGVDSNPNEQ